MKVPVKFGSLNPMMVLENNIFKLSWAWDQRWASGGPCFILLWSKTHSDWLKLSNYFWS
jgi:hypothetical protein